MVNLSTIETRYGLELNRGLGRSKVFFVEVQKLDSKCKFRRRARRR